jgi:tRNA (guanine-N7-)-methyltransferase
VGEAMVDRLHVYFPDPWPKRRHRKRRFFTEEMPAAIHRVLKPSGLLLVCTDNAACAGEISRVLGASPLLVRDQEEERRLLAAEPGHGFSPTNFERKYLAEGRIIRRYAFRRA